MRETRVAFACALVLLSATSSFAVPEWAVAVFPSGEEFSLEIAADPRARAYGYMYREKIGPNEGMLFIFDEPGLHGIWMRNCKVALDIVWLDDGFRVVDIAHGRQPCPDLGECPTAAPMGPARYVIEVVAGTAKREELSRGDRVKILAEPPIP